MERFWEIMDFQVGANTVYDFFYALIFFIGIFIFFKLFKTVIVHRLKKMSKRTAEVLDDQVVLLIEGISSFFYFMVSVYVPLKFLNLGIYVEKGLDVIFLTTVVYQVIRFLQALIEYGFNKFVTTKGGRSAQQAKTTSYGLKLVIKILLWSVGLLLILANIGINVTSLIAGLGVGGIAIALAVQNILGDIFSSFSIYFDRPFEVGDYIVIGTDEGTVEKIGLKSTRLTSLQGEELIVSNRELTSTRVQNFKKMKRRRVKVDLSVEYGTTTAKLKEIEGIVKKAVEDQAETEFGRCRFGAFGDFGMTFSIVYFVLSNDYDFFAERQEQINFSIKDGFEKAGIEMAYPIERVLGGK